jgi:hypothetical protein
VTAWELYEIFVSAPDAASAIGDVRHMWLELGPEAFRYRDGGVETIMVIGEPEVAS